MLPFVGCWIWLAPADADWLCCPFADGITYMPVTTDSFVFKVAHGWQFPPFAICLGSSYMQRMLVKLPLLARAALSCPGFEDYCCYMRGVVSLGRARGLPV